MFIRYVVLHRIECTLLLALCHSRRQIQNLCVGNIRRFNRATTVSSRREMGSRGFSKPKMSRHSSTCFIGQQLSTDRIGTCEIQPITSKEQAFATSVCKQTEKASQFSLESSVALLVGWTLCFSLLDDDDAGEFHYRFHQPVANLYGE